MQVIPQLVPLQVAWAFGGVGQGVHEAPHELTAVLARQTPLQSCVPCGHCPLHAAPAGKHAPAHSCWPSGQAGTQACPLQLTDPPVGATQGAQAVPQLLMPLFERHCPLHSWKPVLHSTPQLPPLQLACPFSGATQGLHAAPQLSTLELETHSPSHS